MIIKNYEELATSEIRKQALDIIESGLNYVNPRTLMKTTVKYNPQFNGVVVHNTSYDLFSGRIFVIGGGKAAGHMAETIEEIIGPEHITAGVVNCIEGDYNCQKIKTIVAGHPLPDKNSEKGVDLMLELKSKYDINKKDLVICLLSGGGSALMSGTVKEVELDDKREANRMLVRSGASIREINVIRKHLSAIKGGRLAEYFSPAKVISIIISDVPGNDLETIASGPTVADPSTFQDAYDILAKFNLLEKAPKTVKEYIEKGCRGEYPESPKNVANADNYIIGDNAAALEIMAHKAKTFDFKPLIVSTEITGDPSVAAQKIAEEIKNGNYEGYQVLLFGIETTPAIPEKHGQGGRNQHFVALSIQALKDFDRDWLVASVNSDGNDFVKDVAGAITDKDSAKLADSKNLVVDDYLNDFNTFEFFKKLENSLIKTGQTGTNVSDLLVYILK